MKQIKEKKFLEIIKKQGIIIDPKYPKSASLCFEKDINIWRFWVIPSEGGRIPFFVDTILEALDKWERIFVWRHLGSWVQTIKGERITEDIQAVIYRGVGISEDNVDVLEFTIRELPELVTLVFNQLIFGWNVGDDLYIIPNHGKQIIKTDHHDVVHVSFRDKAGMDEYIKRLAEKGFKLPDELPDETFKRPDWMK